MVHITLGTIHTYIHTYIYTYMFVYILIHVLYREKGSSKSTADPRNLALPPGSAPWLNLLHLLDEETDISEIVNKKY
jgi:hypothetical protein